MKLKYYSGAQVTSILEKLPSKEYLEMLNAFAKEPSADVVERKKGKWQLCNVLDYAQRPTGRRVLRCPFCEYLTDDFRSIVEYNHELTNFCPNCGAVMDERGEDERTD